MKKLVIYLSLILGLTLMSTSMASAQKLVIGSEMPSLKGVKWKNHTPQDEMAMLIEFFHNGNASSNKFFKELEDIHAKYSGKLQIVVLTRDDDESLDFLKSACGDKYVIGHDPTGEVFTSFGVKYLPFSMLFNAKGELCWLGNLGTLEEGDMKDAL